MTKLRTYAKKRTSRSMTLAPEPMQSMFESPTNSLAASHVGSIQQPLAANSLVQRQAIGHQVGRVAVFPTVDFSPLQRKRKNHHSDTPSSTIVQPQLTIGQPGDAYEQEADRVAAQVVERLDQNSAIAAQPPSSQVQRQSEADEQPSIQPLVQMQASAGGNLAAPTHLEHAINTARSGGSPLSEEVKAPMEQAFNADFRHVKVHTDGTSDQLNRSLNSKAFTTNNDIFFKQDAYDPGSRDGNQLLAHELTHVVQQSGGIVQRSPMYVQRVSWGDIGNSFKKGFQSMHDFDRKVKTTISDAVSNYAKNKWEEIRTDPADDKKTNEFKDTVKKEKDKSTDSMHSSLQIAGKGLLTGIAGGEAGISKYIFGGYGEGTFWERQTPLSSESSKRLDKKAEIAKLLAKAQEEARGHMENPMEAARKQADGETSTTELDKYKNLRKKALLNKENKSAKKDAGKALNQQASLDAATHIISSNSSAQSAIDQGINTYKKEFDICVDEYIEGASGFWEKLHNYSTFGGAKGIRNRDRRVAIALDEKRGGSFKKEVREAAQSKAASKAKDEVEETISKDLEIIKSYANSILDKQKDTNVQNKAVQTHVGGSLSSFAALGVALDLAVPDDGDLTKVDTTLSIPIATIPGLFIDFSLRGEAIRDDGFVSLGIDVDIAAGGKVDVGAFKVEAMMAIGGYMETKGKDAAEAMTMISYGLYQGFREANVPKKIIHGIWSMDGYSGKSKDEEVNQWSSAVEGSLSEHASFEMGGYGAVKAGAEGGLGEGAIKAKAKAELKERRGRVYTQKTINKAKKQTGLPTGENRKSSEQRLDVQLGPVAGDIYHRTDYVEEPNTSSWLPPKLRPIETRYRGGLGFVLPNQGFAGVASDAILSAADAIQNAFKNAGVSWSELERQKVNKETEKAENKERQQIANSMEPDNALKQSVSMAEGAARRKLTEEEILSLKNEIGIAYENKARKNANEKTADSITAGLAKSGVTTTASAGWGVRGVLKANEQKIVEAAQNAAGVTSGRAAEKAKLMGNIASRKKYVPLENSDQFVKKDILKHEKGLVEKVTDKVNITSESQTKFMLVIGGGKKEGEFWKHSLALQKYMENDIGLMTAGGGLKVNAQRRKTIWKWRF